jgi:hypothetical protein
VSVVSTYVRFVQILGLVIGTLVQPVAERVPLHELDSLLDTAYWNERMLAVPPINADSLVLQLKVRFTSVFPSFSITNVPPALDEENPAQPVLEIVVESLIARVQLVYPPVVLTVPVPKLMLLIANLTEVVVDTLILAVPVPVA